MTRFRAVLLGTLLVFGATACQVVPKFAPIGSVGSDSDRIGCNKADNKITVVVSSHLDPSCAYTRSIQITASNVVFDCRGAHIAKDPTTRDRLGIEIVSPIDIPLSNVTVRNCIIEDFFNNMRIRRDGFRDLVQGSEYDNGFSNIRIENNRFFDSEASGLFVDAYMTGVMLTGNEVARSGGVGVYLEGGSKGTVVENNWIHDNGFRDVTPEGLPITVNGVEFRYHSTGREGLAIDGSRDNIIRNNSIWANSAGGIFLYKNCGEDITTNPDGWWFRPYGSSGNLIEGNAIGTEKNGIWVGSRMAENQYFMDCSDTPFVDAPLRKLFLDPSPDNIIRGNTISNVTHGIRIEDDGNQIIDNTFNLLFEGQESILIGTKDRTEVLGQPVTGTTVTGNQTKAEFSSDPYGWIHGESGTTFENNTMNGALAVLVPGVQPPINPWLFATDIFLPT